MGCRVGGYGVALFGSDLPASYKPRISLTFKRIGRSGPGSFDRGARPGGRDEVKGETTVSQLRIIPERIGERILYSVGQSGEW